MRKKEKGLMLYAAYETGRPVVLKDGVEEGKGLDLQNHMEVMDKGKMGDVFYSVDVGEMGFLIRLKAVEEKIVVEHHQVLTDGISTITSNLVNVYDFGLNQLGEAKEYVDELVKKRLN